ncbi:MAG: gfo/Idh/MocA family oxidoreductase [Calditrichaeota bacterium]|nr:MAG: gfo/Idh/MocA family oxidoreductase [Calditrichota bacterium]
MNRRTFLKNAAVLTAGATILPYCSPIIKRRPANSKLNIAMIGCGNIANMAFEGCINENIVALCDVDSNMLFRYAEEYPHIKKAKTFSDFRVMLDKMDDEIDAVCINTPDHTHFVATIACMERGLHVFTQKPLTHNIWQARTLQKAMHKYNVITNMGNQGHTFGGIRRLREWYEADVFGQITEVHSWMPGPHWNGGYFPESVSFPLSEDPIPEGLDYDLWLGPNAETPFHKEYHPKRWRGFTQFGTGTFGDWFCHVADAPVWLLDLYEPISIEAEQVTQRNHLIAHDSVTVRYEFAHRGTKKPCTFYWHNGPNATPGYLKEKWEFSQDLPDNGTIYKGEKTIGTTNHRSDSPRLLNLDEMRELNKLKLPEKYPRVIGGPVEEFVRAVKGDGPMPGANFDYAAPLTEVMLLGIIAAQHGGKIEWDAKDMKITNRPELNQYLKEPVRKGWEYGENLWRRFWFF